MKTEKELKEMGRGLIETAKQVDWTDVTRIKKITRNLHMIRTSISILADNPTEDLLLNLLKKTDSKETKDCVNYLLS